jgi:pilus assembly protein CpaD
VIRRFIRKDAKMASKTSVLLLAAALGGCAHQVSPVPEAGAEPVHQPVVTRTQFVFDAATPGGTLPSAEAARLAAWFQGLGLRFGDTVYIDGGYEAARAQVSQIAGNHGLLVSQGSPVTAGPVGPGNVRVVVTRAVATVPDCPNWERPSQPNYNNKAMPNFGCGVNTNFALQVANPEDLVHGRAGSGVGDAQAASKAVNMYRNWPLTAVTPGQSLRPLKDADTKKDE